jgi:hypothetical protein
VGVGKGRRRMRTKVLPLPQLCPDLLFLANALIEGGKWVPNGNNKLIMELLYLIIIYSYYFIAPGWR